MSLGQSVLSVDGYALANKNVNVELFIFKLYLHFYFKYFSLPACLQNARNICL